VSTLIKDEKSDVSPEVKSNEQKKDFFHQIVEQTNPIGGEIREALRLVKEANDRARMLSTTAKIESNRLGDIGRDFLVVSNSIDELSTKTDAAIEKMKIETVEGIEDNNDGYITKNEITPIPESNKKL